MTTALVNREFSEVGTAEICESFIESGIEIRRFWKPMHLQPLYSDTSYVGSGVDEDIFNRGICLPSSSNMATKEQDTVVAKMNEIIV